MLPFLNNKKKQSTGLIISERKPDVMNEDMDQDVPLEACGADLLSAIESKDHKAIAAALRAAFEIMDSEPHTEGPHLNEDEI